MVLSLPRSTSLPLALVLPSLGLLVAYLYALSRRPEIPDYLVVENRECRVLHAVRPADETASVHGFPRWYGKSISPYDSRLVGSDADGEKAVDVLLVIGEYIKLSFWKPVLIDTRSALCVSEGLTGASLS